MTLSESVDLEEVARATEGFSGADLQALVYNAQLEIIHETIAASSSAGDGGATGNTEDEEQDIEYEVLLSGGKDSGKAVKSRAEEAAFQKQVSVLSVCAGTLMMANWHIFSAATYSC